MVKLIDGVLYRQKPDQDTGDWLLAIPESLKETVLSLHHDLPTAGHQGVARTRSRMKKKRFSGFKCQKIQSPMYYLAMSATRTKRTRLMERSH